jgi:gas vesicle protein
MPTQSSKASSKAKSKAKTKAKATSKAKSAPVTPLSRTEQVRSAAERAVDLPVGAVLEVSDRVADLVEPFSGRTAAEKQLKSYGTQLRRTVKRTERRGASARRKASTEARKTRNKVEREARKRQQRVETTLKRNRTEVEQRVRKAADQLAALR